VKPPERPEHQPRPKASPEDIKAAKAALAITRAVADTIQALGSVPSGHLYAQLMGHMDIHTYDKIIGILTRGGLVKEDGFHRLTWIGPGKPKEANVT
jgi:hypothetical protein